MSNDLILANIVKEHAASLSYFNVLTVVDINESGDFEEKTRSYEELWVNGQAVATSLIDSGMQLEDRFGIFMHNEVEFVDVMVGSSIAGAVFVPVDPRTKGQKLVYMLDFTECRGVVVSDVCLPALLEVIGQLPRLEWIWVVGSGGLPDSGLAARVEIKTFEMILQNSSPELPILVEDASRPMQMLFTSGTTGDPKAILSPYSRMGTAKMAYELFNLNENDRLYTGLSLTHANAQLLTLGLSLTAGIACVISKRFTKSRLWDITRTYGCTVFNLLGGMTNAIYSEPPRPDDCENPVRMVVSAGMPLAIWNAFRDRFNVDIYEFYGAAEGGLTINPCGDGPVGSIGKPPSNLIAKILDENGDECPVGEPGEIAFQNADGTSPQVAYFKNSKATAKKLKNNHLNMGDVGYKDEDGWLYFLFRKGGGIRKNGEFISQGVLEKTLAEASSVSDVFVYGIETEQSAPGEKNIVAAIVPKVDKEFSALKIFDHCKQSLEHSHIPDFVQIVKYIPKTASEKPLERFLFEDFKLKRNNIVTRSNA